MKTFLIPTFAALCSVWLLGRVQAEPIQLPDEVRAVMASRCNDCHSEDASEGGVRLDNLETIEASGQIDLLNRAQEQIFFGMMPPEDADQPTEAEKLVLAGWIRSELQKRHASKLDDKFRYPGYGNLIDHEKLFSGEIQEKPFTPARRWLVSPQIFHERVIDVFQLEGRNRDGFAKFGQSFYGVTNPFLLPERTGVRYFDLESLDGGHLLVMLDNAKWIAGKQTREARVKHGEIDANEFPDQRDRWTPRMTPEAFEVIIMNDSFPTEEQMVDAIQAQFEAVLRRRATDDEVAKYLELTRASIQQSGNTKGLEEMLVAVLLESEFLYREEFGAGPADQFGRRKLSPREAAFAISYALGDRGPDAQLLKAAEGGRLETKEDYRREVERLLADPNYYSGQIDPSLNSKNYRSNETSHPKIVRFFREFFGYPGAVRVFKDIGRSGGKYQNPGRGTQGTGGRLVLEADRILTQYVEQDQHVFENLLTFDDFIVYHEKDTKTEQETLRQWREVWEELKETDWKNNPEKVLEENLEFVKARPALGIKDMTRAGELVNYMHFFAESFGVGRTPFPRVPWSHGYYLHHSVFYNLPPTPDVGRYGSWKSTKYRNDVEPMVFWDYPAEQPFKIDHRCGMLTHPAWLIAHSSNFHTNPVTRGRWIREKLLAGRVPDVPITVDAQVPDDPHKTFRQRLDMVTKESECWKCHKQMNPLGVSFEMYDDFGRWRTEEPLEHPDNLISKGNDKTTFDVYPFAPIETDGVLEGTGKEELDGEVENAIEMTQRLAQSDRVRQSIIRHAFRFYMGRNEMLSDSQTLIDADRAYVESDGSFQAVIVSLLTSDSFMYRK